MFEALIAVGELTGAVMNLGKCCPPAREMEILGIVYDAVRGLADYQKRKSPNISTESTIF